MDFKKSKNKHKKHKRKNTSELIKKQMEFYFSDANLQKDRFLKKEIEATKDGFVDVEMFTRFNKIRALTENLDDIIAAIQSSSFIKMDESGSKVGRVNKFKEPTDSDDRTVYVEFLPPHATVEWVERVFKDCGKVVYVSLPKFKSSGDLKGFAFVEFENSKQALNACQQMNRPPAPFLHRKPGLFPKASKTEKELVKKLYKTSGTKNADEMCDGGLEDSVIDEQSTEQKDEEDEKDGEGKDDGSVSHDGIKKRKRVFNDDDDDDKNVETKKFKDDNDDLDENVEEGKGKDVDDVSTVNDGDMVNKDDDKDSVKDAIHDQKSEDKKNKKKKKKKKNDKVNVSSDNCDTDKTTNQNLGKNIQTPKAQLRVISKAEWYELKKQYLKDQEQKMSLLKKKIKLVKEVLHTTKEMTQPNENHNKDCNSEDTNTSNVAEESKDDNCNEEINCNENKNVLKEISKDKNVKNNKEIKNSLEYVKDCIIKIILRETMTKKSIKEMIEGNFETPKIAFIDLPDGAVQGFIRLNASGDASAIVNLNLEGVQLQLLKGDEEKDYWQKIFNDREKRLSSKSKNKKRGKDKIVKKADDCMHKLKKNQHIVFQ